MNISKLLLDDGLVVEEDQRPTKGKPVSKSADLLRIKALPERERPAAETLQRVAALLKKQLGRFETQCECVSKFRRRCCSELKEIQAFALLEMAQRGGLLGPIGVGHGKTLLDLLAAMVIENCQTAVLLLPPGLKSQLLETDWAFYGQHWQLPNLAGGRWHVPGRPTLHVVAFTELSGTKHSMLLDTLKPDLIIVDEGHHISRPDAARTKRLNRYLDAHPECRFVVWSGTLTRRSIRDWAHLSKHALREGSPAPLIYPVVEEWAGALDPANFKAPVGALIEFVRPGETVEAALKRRRITTHGVVASGDEDSCQASLIIAERKLEAPEKVRALLNEIESKWERPDGELLRDVLEAAACAREMSAGFYYHWVWPRGESFEVRQRWLNVRREYFKELRERVSRGGPNMDSPALVEAAAARWYLGYAVQPEDGRRKPIQYPPETKNGPLPVWKSEYWKEWQEVEPTAKPQTSTTWVDDYLVRDAAAWLQQNRGVVWYLHTAFGAALERLSGFKRFGSGSEASETIGRERGDRSIIASIKAHGTGKNLQMFDRALVANPPSAGDVWEQLLGRHHRDGQLSDEVTFEVYRHTKSMREALEKAQDLSRFIQNTFGGAQKLVSKASWQFDVGSN